MDKGKRKNITKFILAYLLGWHMALLEKGNLGIVQSQQGNFFLQKECARTQIGLGSSLVLCFLTLI